MLLTHSFQTEVKRLIIMSELYCWYKGWYVTVLLVQGVVCNSLNKSTQTGY
jgi:hypothetical protein